MTLPQDLSGRRKITSPPYVSYSIKLISHFFQHILLANLLQSMNIYVGGAGGVNSGNICRTKPDKYGLKCWILADSRTFYPITVEVYTGANVSLSNKPEDVVLRLASVLPPWHVVVGDNYFTSLQLVRSLFNNFHLYYIGTVGKRRRFVPKSANVVKGVDLYSSTFYYSDKHTLVSYIRKPNKNVLLLSNFHRKGEIPTDSPKEKPQIILDYNRYKAGVDKLDQMNKEFRPYRATRRWTLVLFF